MDENLGFLFISIGMCFLMLTFTMNVKNVVRAVLLRSSIVSNIAGTTNILIVYMILFV
ncbi:hypothetical protein [Bacillus wiedmannii]|uniref:hypothetical protein n=1 Tax=Bacillus wiedmannii TaxID=1890302 RepID=UPI00086BC19E|nr:hypothetical protein [Bacillus wiedmannii]SCN41940.1 Uncharacterized protein BCRIVMBC938_06041 [Bacillus wiedmannii]